MRNTTTLNFKPFVMGLSMLAPMAASAQFSGDLDATFAQFGHFQYDESNGQDDVLTGVATDPVDNTSYLVGYTDNGMNEDALIVSVWQNGAINNVFANSGSFTFDPQIGADDRFTCVALQSDGRILVGGYTEGANRDMLIARLGENGLPDNTFDSNGSVIIDGAFGGDDEVLDIQELSTGKIVVTGYSTVSANETDMWLARLNEDGSLDGTFGTNGVITIDLGEATEYAWSVEEMPNGSIAVGGVSGNKGAVAMVTSSGVLDVNFSVDGKTTFNVQDQAAVTDLIAMADGKLLASGTSLSGADGFEAFSKMFADNGNISLTFANGGWESDVDPTTNALDTSFVLYDAMRMDDGKILLAGNLLEAQSDVTLILLNADGTVSTSFGSNGMRSYDLGGNANESNAQLSQWSDGSIMLATTIDGADTDLLVYKLSAIVTGIDVPESGLTALSLYPNPAQDQMQVSFELNDRKALELSITDLTGKVVMRQQNQFVSGANQLQLDVQNLASGYYVLRLNGEALPFVKK